MSLRARVTARGNEAASSRSSSMQAHVQQRVRLVLLAWWRSASWSVGWPSGAGVATASGLPHSVQVPTVSVFAVM